MYFLKVYSSKGLVHDRAKLFTISFYPKLHTAAVEGHSQIDQPFLARLHFTFV